MSTTTYKKKQVDTDFSGLGGMMKLMETLSGGKKSEKAGGNKQKIAVVYAVGEITEGKSSSEHFRRQHARLDHDGRGPQEGVRRSQGRGRRAADR